MSANRIGYGQFTAAQLKIIQEVISLFVFVAFAWLYLGERLRWNEAAAFAPVLAAVRRESADVAICVGRRVSEGSCKGRQELPGIGVRISR